MLIKEKILAKLSELHSTAMLHLGMMMAAASKPNTSKHTFKSLKKGWVKTNEKVIQL